MATFVTGILPTQDVTQLESQLGGISGIDRTRLSVITTAAQTDEHDRSFLNFIHSEGGDIDGGSPGTLASSSPILTTMGGTGVPGINETAFGEVEDAGTFGALQRLGLRAFPEDEAENFADALDAGRTVATYTCAPEEAPGIESAFRSAGALNVRTFSK